MPGILYVVLAFKKLKDAQLFTETGDISLASERKLLPIDWNIHDVADVTKIFTEFYEYFIFCEVNVGMANITFVAGKASAS